MGKADHFTKSDISAEMLQAGLAAFLRSLRQDHLSDCLVSLPEDQGLSERSSSICEAMICSSPDDFRNRFSRSLVESI